MSTAPAPDSIKTSKLRSSCENCGNAKVRCDRGQPECARCISLGSSCVYGISRKLGKPPRKRLCAHSKDGNRSMIVVKNPQETNELAQQTPDSFTKILPVSNINTTTHQQPGPDLDPFNLLHVWAPSDMWGADFIFPSLSNDAGIFPALEPINNASESFDTPEHHSCPRGSYELFRDLICPAPFLHAPKSSSDMVPAQLDQVLHFNRDAIDRLKRLLECSCAKSGHRIMVHASIISRILIWYQQAAGLNSVASRTSMAFSSPSTEARETRTVKSAILSQATGFAVNQSPISVGSFNVEDPALQTAIGIQLILSELKVAADVIQLFTTQQSEDLSDHGVTSLYLHLGAWLRSELSRTVNILKQRLSEVQNWDLHPPESQG